MHDRNNYNAIIVTSTNTLTHGCKSTIITNTVTSILRDAFAYCENLTSVTFEGLAGYTWYQNTSRYVTNGTEITEDLSDPSVAVTCLTSTYIDKYWYKEEN